MKRDLKIQNCSYMLYPITTYESRLRLRCKAALCISMDVLSSHEILKRTLESCPLDEQTAFNFK